MYDWRSIIDSHTEAMGVSPTRRLDSTGVTVESPLSFSTVFGDKALDHAMYSYAVVSDDVDIFTLGLYIIRIPKRRDNYLIITGTLRQWRDAVLYGCIDDISFECRTIMNLVYMHLSKAGCKSLWSGYSTIKLQDGTIKLCKSN